MYKIFNIPLPEPKVITLQEFYNSMQNQKYRKHYERLINRAKDRIAEGYVEKHHIIPRCSGGLDEEENYAYLTAEEHYVAHQLLVKLFTNNLSLVYAVNMMSLNKYGYRCNNKLYGWLKIKFRNACINKSDETRAKMSESAKVKVFTKEHRDNMSKSRKGKSRSKEAIKKMVTTLKNKTVEEKKATSEKLSRASKNRPPVSEETRRKISEANKGKKKPPFTKEHRTNMSIAFTGRTISQEHKNAVGNANRRRVVTKESTEKRIMTMRKNKADKKIIKEILQVWGCAL